MSVRLKEFFMKSRAILGGILSVVLVFGLVLAACSNPAGSGPEVPPPAGPETTARKVTTGAMSKAEADNIFDWSVNAAGGAVIKKLQNVALLDAYLNPPPEDTAKADVSRAGADESKANRLVIDKIRGHNVVEIRDKAFAPDGAGKSLGDIGIEVVTLPETLQVIAPTAFAGAGLEKIEVPPAVTEQESAAASGIAAQIEALEEALE
jgi:hypothetical protein